MSTVANDVPFHGKWKVQILCAMRSGIGSGIRHAEFGGAVRIESEVV
jgi:hypothetical protein